MRIADLGRNLHPLDKGRALGPKPLAEDDLARSATVSVCGVEPADAEAARMIEQLKRLLFTVAGAAQVRRRADPSEIAATEDDAVEVARAKHRRPSTNYAGRTLLANPWPAKGKRRGRAAIAAGELRLVGDSAMVDAI